MNLNLIYRGIFFLNLFCIPELATDKKQDTRPEMIHSVGYMLVFLQTPLICPSVKQKYRQCFSSLFKRKSLSMVWNGYTADLEENSGQNSRSGTPSFISEDFGGKLWNVMGPKTLALAQEKFGLSNADFSLAGNNIHLQGNWKKKRRKERKGKSWVQTYL